MRLGLEPFAVRNRACSVLGTLAQLVQHALVEALAEFHTKARIKRHGSKVALLAKGISMPADSLDDEESPSPR